MQGLKSRFPQWNDQDRIKTPMITLTTDFGTRDGFVGAMKGKILSINPAARITDITHDIEPQDILHASWTVYRSTREFPEESIHVVVVDPGVGSDRRAVLLKSNNRWFIGPDNGVFSRIIREWGSEEIHVIRNHTEWWESHSSFDGLALFSPVAAHLSMGLEPLRFCDPIQKTLILLKYPAVEVGESSISGRILMFDRFGNAMTNISGKALSTLPKEGITVSCSNRSFTCVDHYQQGEQKPAIALINSDGYLELSVFGGSARDRFGLKKGDKVVVR